MSASASNVGARVGLFRMPLFTLRAFADGLWLNGSDFLGELSRHWILGSAIAAGISAGITFLSATPVGWEGVRDSVVAVSVWGNLSKREVFRDARS